MPLRFRLRLIYCWSLGASHASWSQQEEGRTFIFCSGKREDRPGCCLDQEIECVAVRSILHINTLSILFFFCCFQLAPSEIHRSRFLCRQIAPKSVACSSCSCRCSWRRPLFVRCFLLALQWNPSISASRFLRRQLAPKSIAHSQRRLAPVSHWSHAPIAAHGEG